MVNIGKALAALVVLIITLGLVVAGVVIVDMKLHIGGAALGVTIVAYVLVGGWVLRRLGFIKESDLADSGFLYKALPWAKWAAVLLIAACSVALLWAMIVNTR